MEIEYTLSRADYLEFQLFAATKSETVKKNKKKARIRVPIIYVILGTILLLLADKVFAIIFYLIGVLWYLLYPTLTKKKYSKYYAKYVDENFKNRFDTPINVRLSENYKTIETTDFEGESKFKTSEIERIFEIERFIYIKMNSGSHLIIPKYKIDNFEELREELKIISKSNNFEIDLELNLNFKEDK